MLKHARVVIIGGGAVGAAIAYHLSIGGVSDCLLIEKDELTSGSTWHAAGNIPTYAASWLGMRAGNYAWQLYSELAEDVNAPITYRHTGAVWPAHGKERMSLYHHLVGVSRSAGFELAMVTPSEIEEMHPFYDARSNDPGGVVGGIYDPYEGDIDPSQLTQALAGRARSNGITIERFTTVTGIKRTNAGEWSVETNKGDVLCETVVNAAGFYGAQVAAMVGQRIPVTTLEHQYVVTSTLDELTQHSDQFPLVRDPDIKYYLRRENDALLLGSYAHDGRPAWPDGPPPQFAHSLFADQVDDIAELVEAAMAHVPLLENAGAQRFVNGPIAYAPDAQPLVGPAYGLPNFYHATGVQIGITHSAAIGKAIAEWITGGETEWDLANWDPRRFGPWATPEYASKRATEMYGLQYAITYPHRLLRAARPVNTTPLYERLATKGAQFGQIGGWERAMWFAREPSQQLKENDEYGHLSFRDDEPWREAVRAECIGVRDCVGVMDHGGFTKFEVHGPGAHAYLDHVFCGALPKPGRVRLGYMLTPNGRLWSEATIAHVTPGEYLLCGPTLALDRDHDWLRELLPVDGTVQLQRGATCDGALMLMGPRSRALLEELTDADVSGQAQPWMSVSNIDVAGVPVTAMRVSYVGELGWELHVESTHLAHLYESISVAGQSHGLVDFGSYALNAMRVEKGYHAWGSDFGTEYTPIDAGLNRFVQTDKGDFVGCAALLGDQAQTPQWVWCGFEVESDDADPMPSDPIFRDGKLAGYVTSASFGFRMGKRLALGYLEYDCHELGASYTIDVLGTPRDAVCQTPHFYDPENRRLRA